MTVVVGFSWPVMHDNAVAVIVDGELVFASEEERHTRHKHSIGEAPVNSMVSAFKFLGEMGIKPDEVDAYACNWDPHLFGYARRLSRFNACFKATVDGPYTFRDAFAVGRSLFNYLGLTEHMFKRVFAKLGVPLPGKIVLHPVEHHLAHAASAYYFSGHQTMTVLTMDGFGERDATTVWSVKNGEFSKVLAMHCSYGSLGFLYESVGTKLGYDTYEGPGKVMGLAPYGQASNYYDLLKRLVKFPEHDLPYFISPPGELKPRRRNELFVRELVDGLISQPLAWDRHGAIALEAANLAWAVQKLCEDAVMQTAVWAKNATGRSDLGLAGGVALNAKSNMVLHYSKAFDDVFVFPAASDSGTTVGAAAYVYEHLLGGKMRNHRLETAYLGPSYSQDEVRRVVQNSKWDAEFIGEESSGIAGLVANGGIVAWYQGRSELGPRALGNRSIVADPRNKKMWKELNEIKGREWWRPLAPSLLDASRYFKDGKSHEFMVMMYEFKEDAKGQVPAVCHVDGTARPQTTTAGQNKVWASLIKSFGAISGQDLVINTSFNLAGEPLVETPADALRSFAVGGFDALYLQGWLIQKSRS